jgi:hypothetical protein
MQIARSFLYNPNFRDQKLSDLASSLGGSVETAVSPTDKYNIETFAHDDLPRFMSLVQYLNPRDQEIIILFALLQKRPTDLSILFGKAGHRAEEDLHKAAHKLAGLIEFGPSPKIEQLESILAGIGIHCFNRRTLAACIWQYARCRDFREMARLIGSRGLRQEMLRVFKKLHATEGRDEGLLAGWILWLVDGSDPRGKGWRARKLRSRERKLGPMTFHTYGAGVSELQEARPATERGGRGQRTSNVKIKRHMKFVLRGDECLIKAR